MENKEIIIQNLTLELTRQCNLNCAHCGRGDSENKTMSDKTIERIFEDIDGAFSIQFTGGETSLATDRLRKVIDEIKKRKTKIRASLIFTNAVNISDEYISLLEELREYIKESNKNDEDFEDTLDYDHKGLIYRFDSQYPLHIVVSLDKFHLESIDKLSDRKKVKENIDRLTKHFPVEIDKICNYTIYDEGRGTQVENIHKTKSPLQRYTGLYYSMKEGYRDLVMIGPIVNISYDGRIIETNKSYSYCDEHAIGNIHEESFYSMLKKLQQEKKFKLVRSGEELYKKYDDINHDTNTTTKMVRKMVKFYRKHKIGMDYEYLFGNKIPDYDEVKK